MKITLIILALLITADSHEWQVVSNSGPAPRYINQMVYVKNSLILFGGKNSNNKGFDDPWEWRDGNWNSLGNGGTKRWDHSYVYMENHDQIFLFGGRKKDEIFDDTWSFDGNEWSRLEIGPLKRYGHSLTYDPKSKTVYLFGGYDGENLLNDLWAFNGEEWTEIETIIKPSPRKTGV